MTTGILIAMISVTAVLAIVFIVVVVISPGSKRDSIPKIRRKDIEIIGGVDVDTGQIGPGKLQTLGIDEMQGTVVVNMYINDRSHPKHVRLKSIGLGQVYDIVISNTVTIGRCTDYCVSDLPSVSKAHCVIFLQNNCVCVRDNNSLNHTYLNGVMISESVLNNGDILRLGDSAEYYVEIY